MTNSLRKNSHLWLPQLAKQELESRQRARTSLAGFIDRHSYEPPPARHHRLIIRKLQEVIDRRNDRLMIFMPPGHAKSFYASVMMPACYLAVNQRHLIIGASYNFDLAKRFSTRVRNVVGDVDYRRVHGFGLKTEDVKNWETEAGGEYYAAGMEGGITGRRADLIIIDDPVKGREDAESPTIRDKTWATYLNDLRTRRKPGCAIIVIQTRWHEDDLSGRILPERYAFTSGKIEARDGEVWDVVNLPAIAEANDLLGRDPGEALWPEFYSLPMLEQERITQGPRGWTSLYQQRPTPAEGGILQAAWWRKWPNGKDLPDVEYIVQSWDTAFSDRDHKDNSRSARTTWGVYTMPGGLNGNTWEGRKGLLLLEAWADHVDYPTLRREARQAYETYQPDTVLIEQKASGQSLIQDMRMAGIPVAAYQPDKDKVTRAYAVQAMLESGQIWHPDRRWAEDVIAECATFPSGVRDDLVDTCTQAWLFVRNMWRVRHPDDELDDDDDDPRAGEISQPAYG